MTSLERFTAITPADLAPGRMRRVRAGGRDLVVVNVDGRWVVVENRCPHAGAPLHDGPLEDCVLTCPWHGSQFDLAAGQVRRGPATAWPRQYAAREFEGWVETAL